MNYFCCSKIIPLTYDNSLSYYEQLCKLTHKMNEIVELLNEKNFEFIQQYIDENFNNLMINAIYNKETETIIFSKGVKK